PVVEGLVKEALESSRQENDPFGEQDKKKPPLDQFVALLDLGPVQKDVVQRAVREGQEQTIALLRTPMSDGSVPLERLMNLFIDPPESPEKQRAAMLDLFGTLATENYPGSDETYGTRLEAVKKRTSETFKRHFTAEQSKEYDRMGQDPLEIQIPDSPWGEVFKEAMERRKNR
ncbi:MAG: hypothetical protein ACYTDX_05605, partial [Planctomycetota bacterium]